MKPHRMALLALILATTILYAQKPGEPSPEPEPEKPVGPVVLRLVAKKTTYALDRGGMTAEAYKRAIADGSVSAPAVDLVLELVNVSKIQQRLRVTGTATKRTLDLQGKGITTRTTPIVREKIAIHILQPGEKYEIPLERLTGNSSNTQSIQTFWTEPGKYTLTATFSTYLYDQPGRQVAPGGGKGKGKANPNPVFIGKGMGRITPVTLTSKSIELTVTEKK